MSKTLLVLAASLYQLPAIRAAKRLGYRVIVTDNVPANPGHALADASFGCDTTDVPAVLALAERERIDGVLAPATDVAVETAAIVAERLGLPGCPPATARLVTRKQVFREFQRTADLPHPGFHPLAAGGACDAAWFDGRTWLLKPNRSSGAKGVFMVAAEMEFRRLLPVTQAFSLDRLAVLEEWIPGTQHTCEGVLQDGRAIIALVTDRETAPPPHAATIGHRVPSRLPPEVQAAAIAEIAGIFARLGVRDGPFDCDFVAGPDGVTVIELTPRLGGNSLSRLLEVALDFDVTAYAVRHACGDAPPPIARTDPRPSAIRILGVKRPGRLFWDATAEAALRREPWLRSLELNVSRGAAVEAFVDGRHRVGEALMVGTTRDEIDERWTDLAQRLRLRAE